MSAAFDSQDRIVEINRLVRQGSDGFTAAYELFAGAGHLLNLEVEGLGDDEMAKWFAANFNHDPMLAQAARFASENEVMSPAFRYAGLLLVDAIKRDEAEHGKEEP